MKTNGLIWIGALCCAGQAIAAPPAALEHKEILSKTYVVDKKYRSMQGPASTVEVRLGETNQRELMWITGYRAVMVGADGKTPMPQEFMCHSNLDIDPRQHIKSVASEPGISGRLFTLSQGQLDIQFPPGFGIPVLSDEPLQLTTQVLNLNLDDPKNLQVRHKVHIKYIRDAATKNVRPLFQKSVYGLALLEGKDGNFGADEEHHEGSGCLPGQNASDHTYSDGQGRKFTGHWVVPPGRQENRTPVGKLLDLPYDTTVHYIAVHLHPFAESLELLDKTTGKTVFKSKARGFANKIGLDSVEYFSSEAGLPLQQDHDYELISIYNNTNQEPQDSMAVMYLYLLDQRFQRPKL